MSTQLQRDQAKKTYRRRKSAGLCVKCGKARGRDGGKTRCKECLDHEKLTRAGL